MTENIDSLIAEAREVLRSMAAGHVPRKADARPQWLIISDLVGALEQSRPSPATVEAVAEVIEDGWRHAATATGIAGAIVTRFFLAETNVSVSAPANNVAAEVLAESTGELVTVHYYDCNCAETSWISKYCDEHHSRTARVPKSALTAAQESQ